jgi:hypothetical protein
MINRKTLQLGPQPYPTIPANHSHNLMLVETDLPLGDVGNRKAMGEE